MVKFSNIARQQSIIEQVWSTKNFDDYDEHTVAFWDFSSGSGSQVLDIIGNYHGDIYGAIWTEPKEPLVEIEISCLVTIVIGVPSVDVYTSENWTEQLREVDFGVLGRGQMSELQTLYVANTGTDTIYAEVVLIGDISEWGLLFISPHKDLGFTQEAFMLMPGRYTPYQLRLNINNDATPDSYSFKLLVREALE